MSAIRASGSPTFDYWLRDTYDDHAIYAMENKDGSRVGLFKVSFEIDDNATVTLGVPAEVTEVTNYESVAKFTADVGVPIRQPDGSYLVRDATFFEVGDYPDKGFSLTEGEADEILKSAAPVPILIEHVQTPFTAEDPFAIGTLTPTRRDGKRLLGDLKLAGWVGDALKGQVAKLSSGFGTLAKTIQECSLVTSPRIEAATLQAAFSAAATARNGRPMNILEQIKAWLSGASEADKAEFKKLVATEAQPSQSPGAHAFAADPEAAALRKQLDNLKTQNQELQKAQIGQLAGEFAAKFASKAPGEHGERLKALFAQAIQDDTGDGSITFGADAKFAAGERAKALESFLSNLPNLNLESGKSTLVAGSAEFSGGEEFPEIDKGALAMLKGNK